jgi:hypothetical protein
MVSTSVFAYKSLSISIGDERGQGYWERKEKAGGDGLMKGNGAVCYLKSGTGPPTAVLPDGMQAWLRGSAPQEGKDLEPPAVAG